MFEKLCRLILLVWLGMTPAWATGLHVLAIHSYSQEYPWTSGQHQSFVKTLTTSLSQPPQLSVEYLNTKMHPLDAAYADRYADLLRMKYAGTPPDALYVTDDDALEFALKHLLDVFPGRPVFFSGINNEAILQHFKGLPVTGVFERKDVLRNMEFIEALHGGSPRFIAVGDDSKTYAAIARDIRRAAAAKPGTDVVFLASSDITRLTTGLARQPSLPVLLTTLGAVHDEHGKVMPPEQTLARLRGVTRAMIFSMEDGYVKDGVVGGRVASSRAQGREAARLLLAWQGGVALETLTPVSMGANEWLVNQAEIQRLDVTLPENMVDQAQFVNIAPDFMERNRSSLLVLAVLLAGALMFGVLFLVISLGKGVE